MNITVRIGAALDGDLTALLYRPMVEAAKRGRAAARKEFEGMAEDARRAGEKAGRGGPYRQNGSASSDPVVARARRTNREVESEQDRHNREMEKKAKEASRAILAEKRKAERELSASIGRAAGNTAGNFGSIVRRGIGVGADVARGAGVDFNLGSAARSRLGLEKRAIDLSNAAYMPSEEGKSAAGIRQNPRVLMAEVQAVANATATDTNAAMEGLQAFVGKTGDLATGRAVLKDMAVLARATGGELQDIVSAAGDVSANLGEVGGRFKTAEEKAQAVAAVMSALAAQGKVGAVEMKDLASQMAKLAASAPQFAGDVVQNMAAMGALAQMARAKGGAASATQATTSVQGFVATFDKGAREKEFKAAKVAIRDKANMLLDPEDIIVNSLKATKGDPGKMNKLFMDAGAKRVTRGFQNIYNQAEQEKQGSGEAAVRAEFAKLRKASMKASETDQSFSASMQSGEAKVQLLKNLIEYQLGNAIEKVSPQLLELAPRVGQVAEAFGRFIGWAASNPWQALFAGAGVALGKSVGEEVMRGASKAVMDGATKMFSGGLGAMGTAGMTLAVAAATIYAASVILDMDKEKKKTAGESTEALLSNANKFAGLLMVEEGKQQAAQFAIDEEMAKPEAKRDKKRIADAELQIKDSRERQSGLVEQARDLREQLEGDMSNAANVQEQRKGGETSFAIKSFLKTAGFGVDAPGRKDVADAEATLAKQDQIRTAIDNLSSAIKSGLVIKDMPALPAGVPALGGATTGPGGG